MKILLSTAAALAMTGSALAYQTATPKISTPIPGIDADMTTSATVSPTGIDVGFDPNVAIAPPAHWTTDQRTMWDEHVAFHPTTWTEQQHAAFQSMRSLPPASWTPEQRMLHEQHLASLPTHWTPEQRTAYERQVATFRTPWMSSTQTAYTTGPAFGTTTAVAMAPASGPLSQPDNSNPERDARGIAVISDAASVPAGFNGISGTTAIGGPLADPATGEAVPGANGNYPACTASVTDNCVQLYERGVRAALSAWQPSGTTAVGTTTGAGGPFDAADKPEDDFLDVDMQRDGDIDVDGDLDADGDNDL